jgi:hypothetical protein
MPESESFTILFYGNPLTPHIDCIQMAITVAVVTKNMCISRCWKAELVAYGSRKQPSSRIMLSVPLKPDHSSVCPVRLDGVQHLVLTPKSLSYQTVYWNRPYE